MFRLKRIISLAIVFFLLSGVLISKPCCGLAALSENKVADVNKFTTAYNTEIPFGEAFQLKNDSLVFGTVEDNCIVLDDSGFAEWNFETSQKAAFVISVKYATLDDAGSSIDFEFLIDGESPFADTQVINLNRLYVRESDSINTDLAENDVKPKFLQSYEWQTAYLTDLSSASNRPFVVILEKGTHTLRINGVRGSFKIDGITFSNYEIPVSYAEYSQMCTQMDYTQPDTEVLSIEGESFWAKNSVIVAPSTDRTSAMTTPQSVYITKLNTVGGNSWKNVGDRVVWKIDVKKAGLYEIAIRFRQNTKDGIFTCRKFMIDGRSPFLEAEDIRFFFDDGWQCEKIGKDENFSFYLSEGEHEISLEAVQGEVSQIINTVSYSLNGLKDICRSITLFAGSELDVNRDYDFAQALPQELELMRSIGKDLKKAVESINNQAGTNGSFVSIIDKLIFQIDTMTENPRVIAKHFSRFKSNIGALGEWLLTASQQPLEIDKIYIMPAGEKTPDADVGFLKNLFFAIKSFFASYVNDYDSIGENGKENKLKIWIQSGRDQGEIMRDLINSDFAKEYDAAVKLEIVTGTLLESVLSGNSPDIVLDNAETAPMDYALRNSVVDFTEFEDFASFADIFPKATLVPVTFNNRIYGIPQTCSFYMMFYRTDIFGEYGYKLPTTWNELCDMIPSFQKNSHEVGIPHDLAMYATLVDQSGGTLYSDDLSYTNINSNTAVEKFVDFTEFFTLYDCPVTYNFSNRFRSGEMPCAIAPYTEYNQLVAFAPEIKGCWSLAPIPSTVLSNGELNNTSVVTNTYIMMMRSSKNKELSWEFIKWYMSDDVQISFARQMESILGSCAKVNTANRQALFDMSWTGYEREALLSQMNNTSAVPQMPGGYYLTRVVNFAFNRVYNNSEDPSEILPDYVEEINDELARKHKEFGLE